MIDRNELQRAWDRVHQSRPGLQKPQAEIVAFAEQLVQFSAGAPVLDAGCGRGRNIVYLSQMGFGAFGCDLSVAGLEIAKTKVEQAQMSAHFSIADLTCLPYADNAFAAVICVHALPFALKADIAQAVLEFRRVLRPAGWVYLDLLNHNSEDYGCGPELEPETFLDPDGMPIHFSTRQELDEFLQGLTVERVIPIESHTDKDVGWTVWARKQK